MARDGRAPAAVTVKTDPPVSVPATGGMAKRSSVLGAIAVRRSGSRAGRAATLGFGPRRLRIHARDAQLGAAYAHLLQLPEDFLRHAFGEVDEAVILADVDVADELAVEPGLIGDRADDISRQHALGVTHFDAEGFHRRAILRLGRTLFAPLSRRALVAGFVRRRFARRARFAGLARAMGFGWLVACALALRVPRPRLARVAIFGLRRQQERFRAVQKRRERRCNLDCRD